MCNRLGIALLTLSQHIPPLPPSACVSPVVHQVVIGDVMWEKLMSIAVVG